MKDSIILEINPVHGPIFEFYIGINPGYIGQEIEINWGTGHIDIQKITEYDTVDDGIWFSKQYYEDSSITSDEEFWHSVIDEPIRITINAPAGSIGSYSQQNPMDWDGYYTWIPLTDIISISGSNITELDFRQSINLKQLRPGLLDNCPNLKHISFTECSNIQSIPRRFFDHNNLLENISYTFAHCTNLNSIPFHLFAHCPNILFAAGTFEECNSLNSIPCSLFSRNCPKISNFNSCFANCLNLNVDINTLGISEENFPQLNNISRMFFNCNEVNGSINEFNSNTKYIKEKDEVFGNEFFKQSNKLI